MALTCPNCGRDVTYVDGDAEAICAACPAGGPDGDTHFDPGFIISGPDFDAPTGAPEGNQSGSERDPAWYLPEHGVTFTSEPHVDGQRDHSQILPEHGVSF